MSLVLLWGTPSQGLFLPHCTCTSVWSDFLPWPCLNLPSPSSTFPAHLLRPDRCSPILSHYQGSPNGPSSHSCLWHTVTSPAELRQGHGEGDFLLSLLTKQPWLLTTMASHQHFLSCAPQAFLRGPSLFTFKAFCFSSRTGPWVAASKSSKRKNRPQQNSQDALEGKFPFWVCCLQEFPMQADVNS